MIIFQMLLQLDKLGGEMVEKHDSDQTNSKKGSSEGKFVESLTETFSGVLHNLDDTVVDVINTAADGLNEHHLASEKNFEKKDQYNK